tara:strand:+ start:513 stop:1160 length:648 start_codon:yes stop_codon:yes gene_type:complete
MSFLVANIPPVKVWVKKQYLYDHQRGHGEFVEGIWCTVKSIQGRALYFETYIPDYAAVYDKLPISAFVNKPTELDLPLEELELWDAFSYHITVIEKTTVPPMAKYLSPSKTWYKGEYLFTIDSCHADANLPNINYSEIPEEHKSFNILELDNGHYAAQPNNRTLFYDKSLTPAEPKQPDFKVSTKEYSVESQTKWTAGDDTNYFYQFKEKKEQVK